MTKNNLWLKYVIYVFVLLMKICGTYFLNMVKIVSYKKAKNILLSTDSSNLITEGEKN